MASDDPKQDHESDGEKGIEQQPLLRVTLTPALLWTLGGLAIGALGGALALGGFIHKTVSDTLALETSREIASLKNKNDELDRSISALSKTLEFQISQNQNADTKLEFLDNYLGYLSNSNPVAKVLFVNVVCAMWKESQTDRVKLQKSPVSIDKISFSGGLTPELRALLSARGVPDTTLDIASRPRPSPSLPEQRVGPFAIQRQTVTPRPSEGEWLNAVNTVKKQISSVDIIKIVSFSDGSKYVLPQEISLIVHAKPECVPF